MIEALPHPEIIRAFKGTLDFYYFRGLYCVRGWPRSPAMPRSPASTATANAFAEIIRTVPRTTPKVTDDAKDQTKHTTWTWRDEIVSAIYGNLFLPPEAPDEVNEVYGKRLFASLAATTFNVNSGTYTFTTVLFFSWPDFLPPPTDFQISIRGNSNQAGQTITLQLADFDNGGLQLSSAGDDLVVSNSSALYDSAIIPIANQPTAPGNRIGLYFKGSNATVDLSAFYIDINLYF